MSMLWILLNYAEIFGQPKNVMISLEETIWHSFNSRSVNKLKGNKMKMKDNEREISYWKGKWNF